MRINLENYGIVTRGSCGIRLGKAQNYMQGGIISGFRRDLGKIMKKFQKTIDIRAKIVYICVVIVWYCPIGGN